MTEPQVSDHNKEFQVNTGDNTVAVKRYRFMPLTEALVIGLSMFAAIFVTTYFIYTHAVSAQKGEIQDGLLRVARTLTMFVDGDLHKTFTSKLQERTDEYKQAIDPLERAVKADPTIAFVYTVVLRDNQVYFILDPTPSGDEDGDGVDDKSNIMEPYPEATPEMLMALREQKAVVEPQVYTDRWGSFLSGYVPFYDSEGEFVGVLGVDISANDYLARFTPIKRATIRAIVTGFFVAFLVGSIVWFTRNFAKVLNEKRIGLIQELQRLLSLSRSSAVAKGEKQTSMPE